VEVDSKTGAVRIGLRAATPFTTVARLRIGQPVSLSGVGTYLPAESLKLEREVWVVPLGDQARMLELIPHLAQTSLRALGVE
jgi:hypothetical protein